MDTYRALSHRLCWLDRFADWLIVRWVALLCVVVVAGFAVSGCSSPSPAFDAGHYAAPDEAGVPAVERAAEDMPAVGEVGHTSDSAAFPAPGRAVSHEQVIVTGQARVSAQDPQKAYESFEAQVSQVGGSVSASTVDLNGDYPRIHAMVRVPADEFATFMAGLDSFGSVVERSTQTQDVGAEVADLDARIQALEKSIERLTTLMGQASSVADLLEAETQLTYRQAELDGLKSQQRWYADQVLMSTLEVTFVSALSFGGESHSVWRQSWDAFVYGVTGVVIVVVWLLPWAVLVAALVLPLVLWRKKKRARALANGALPVHTSVDSPKEGSVGSENKQN